MRYYFVCALARTGSTLLLTFLRSLKFAGQPLDFFEERRRNSNGFGELTDAEFLETILRKGTTPNGVWGAKLHFYSIEILHNALKSYSFDSTAFWELFQNQFPDAKFIYITRRNKLRQAISWKKAERTQQWMSVKRRKRRLGAYNAYQIAGLLHRVSVEEVMWEDFFTLHGIQPLRVYYEDLVDPTLQERVLIDVLDHVSVPYSVPLQFSTHIEKQADLTSEKWYHRYLHEGRFTASLSQYYASIAAPDEGVNKLHPAFGSLSAAEKQEVYDSYGQSR